LISLRDVSFKPQLVSFVALILSSCIEEAKENSLPQEAKRGSEIPIHGDTNNSAGLSPEQPDILLSVLHWRFVLVTADVPSD